MMMLMDMPDGDENCEQYIRQHSVADLSEFRSTDTTNR